MKTNGFPLRGAAIEIRWMSVAGLLSVALLGTGLRAAGQGPPGDNPPAAGAGVKGEVGDLISIWDCVDPRTRRSSRLIEFRRDGTYEQQKVLGTSTIQRIPGQFRMERGILTLFYVHANTGREDVMERGRVEWVDGGLFKMTLIDGYDVPPRDRNRVYEFHRQ